MAINFALRAIPSGYFLPPWETEQGAAPYLTAAQVNAGIELRQQLGLEKEATVAEVKTAYQKRRDEHETRCRNARYTSNRKIGEATTES